MNGKGKILDYGRIMSVCAEKAYERAGFTKINPVVGAAVVKDGAVISLGVHEFFGGPHAEVNAIDAAGEAAKNADLLVTLEPCSTWGKTPPCTDKIIAAGIKNVYIGVTDPNPLHAGRGIERLRNAGINVLTGVEALKCALLIEDFIKSKLTVRPYVTIKTAMSADGRIATRTGDSRWITSEESRKEVHRIRGRSGAVLTGIGTVIADDPMLTNRLEGASRQPVRVVLDGAASLPLSSKLVKSAADIPVVVFTSERADTEKVKKLKGCGVEVYAAPSVPNGLDIDFILKSLYEKDIMTVMVEAGPSVTGSFRDEDAADALELFIAPKLIGGVLAPAGMGGEGALYLKDAREFASMNIETCGRDARIRARIKDYTEYVPEISRGGCA